MNKMKKLFAAASSILLAALLAGCGIFTVNADRDMAQVVARVNGAEITKGEVVGIADAYAQYQGFKTTDANYKDELKSVRTEYVESLIKNKLVLTHGKDYGITGLSADEQKQADTQYQQNINTAKSTASDALKAEGVTNPTDQQIMDRVNKNFAANHSSPDKMKKSLEEQMLVDKTSQAMRNTVQDKDLSEQEVKEFYDSALSTQKSTYDATPSEFESAYNNKQFLVYYLPGYRLVKQIFIPVSDADKTNLDTLAQNNDPTVGTVSQQALAKIKPTVDEVYAALKNGKTFDELITTYNKDTGEASYPDGYLIGDKTDVSAITESSSEEFYLTDIKTAAMKLAKAGDYSVDAIATQYGYHILQYVKDITPVGEVPYDTIKDQARTNALADKQEKAYNDLLAKWGKEDKIDRYFDILNP